MAYEMGPTCPETSVTSYKTTPSNAPVDLRELYKYLSENNDASLKFLSGSSLGMAAGKELSWKSVRSKFLVP
jgi:hypothetical protein